MCVKCRVGSERWVGEEEAEEEEENQDVVFALENTEDKKGQCKSKGKRRHQTGGNKFP